MLGGGSSEDPDDKKNDNESNHKLTEENRDVDSAMIPISETTKPRERNSGITIREPTGSQSVLASPLKNLKILRESIVGSSSSSVVSVALPIEISSQSFNGGTITTTTTSFSSSSIPVAVPQDRRVETEAITTSSSLSVIPSSSSLQDSVFGSSSSGSNNTRPSSSLPYSVPLGSSTPSFFNGTIRSKIMSLVQSYGGRPQDYLTTAMTRPHGLTQFHPNLPIADGIPIAIRRYSQPRLDSITRSLSLSLNPANLSIYRSQQQPQRPLFLPLDPNMRNLIATAVLGNSQAPAEDISRIFRIVSDIPSSSNLHGPNFQPSIQGNMTRPLSVNPHIPHSVSRPIRATTLSDLVGSSRSVQAQSTNQQQHHPSSSSLMGLPQHHLRPYDLSQQPPLMLQDVGGGLDLNLPANNEDDDGEEDEGLDLNLPAPDE
ncbi:unnamed protein product [Arabis nemorensis]|uniref:C2 PI3K-type domain-containing protein n=1 Tax=Arabis nemorensis TaxID=586526 RepID=A0A565B8M8_9BRAS|nr:unnamed protein product [Arabis nemorensis]